MYKIIHFNESRHSLENSLKKANFILKHKPSAIIFENPRNSFNPNNLFQWKKTTKKHIKKYPWLQADLKIIESILELKKKQKVILLNMDGPRELTSLHEPIVKLQERFYFDLWNLLREKLVYRLNYLKKEIEKRKVNPQILLESHKFVDRKYLFYDRNCIVHGDLKSVHVIPTKRGIKFIDLALTGISNPWCDLSFLCMEEQKNKRQMFNEIRDLSYFHFGQRLGLNKNKISEYLQSSMFYRTLYCFGFALRHRPQKSLDRIIKELENIINIDI